MPPPITIALATYQGARFLLPQLDSFAAQTFADWRLLISDDGSTDDTLDISAGFASSHPAGRVRIIGGPGRGSTSNFLHLIEQADPDHWLALSDQDDVWLPDKLERAARFLKDQNGPAVYAARTTICDEALNPVAPAPAFVRPLRFRNALIQACLPGNTTVLNQSAAALLRRATRAAREAGIISHDWWIYQLLSGAGAAMMRDRAQVLLYRQHPENLMGRNDTTRARAARLNMLTDGTFAGWLRQNQAALMPVQELLTPENRDLLHRFGHALERPGPAMMAAFIRMGLYRQTRSGTAAVMAAALAGRLRIRSG